MPKEPMFGAEPFVNTFDFMQNQGFVDLLDDLTVRTGNIIAPVNYLIDPTTSPELLHFFAKIKVSGPAFVRIFEQDSLFDVVGGTEVTVRYNARFDLPSVGGCKVFFGPTVNNKGSTQKGNIHLGVRGSQGSGNDSTGEENIGERIFDNKKLYLIEIDVEFDATAVLASFAYFSKDPKW